MPAFAGMTAECDEVQGKAILLIVGGGIAAYKSLDLTRRLKERGGLLPCPSRFLRHGVAEGSGALLLARKRRSEQWIEQRSATS